MSLCEKYGLTLAVWQPPAIITKHLQNLNEDSVLMDTDPNELNLDAVPVAAIKSNDITMKEIVEQVNSDENMELSPSNIVPHTEQSENEDDKAEMAVDKANCFEASPPLFDSDSDTEEFENVILSQSDTVFAEQPAKMEPENQDADPQSPKEQPMQENAINNINYMPSKKKMKRLNSGSLTPLMLQLTGNIVDEDFATKLCLLKTTDEMIDLCAEQSLRVDQLMDELFSVR